MQGPEPWKTVGRISFDHWDLWFLVVLVTDHEDDWRALGARFAEKIARHGFERDDAEAKLSHLADLERRVKRCGKTAAALVGKPIDKRLVTKARNKILEQAVDDRHKTRAMCDTPRRLLEARARRGHWRRFPVSPARFESAFSVDTGTRTFYTERASFGIARRMHRDLASAEKRCKRPAERLALYRAFLTVHLEVMERADDSCGVLGDAYQEHLSEYWEIDLAATGIAPEVYYRDFLELATWEDYGLIDDMEAFFTGAGPEQDARIESILREIIAELRSHRLDYPVEKAMSHLGALYVARRQYDKFVDYAAEMGSRAWQPIMRLAQAAWQVRKRDLAIEIFAAADQPGFHQDYLRKECEKLTGWPPPTFRRKARLAIVR